METQKILGAILIALLIPTFGNVVGDHLVHPAMLAENAYPAPLTDEAAQVADSSLLDAAGIAVVEQSPETVAALSVVSLGSGDPEAGARIAKKCVSCHSFDQAGKAKLGPPLWGIVGAAKAQYPGFSYSKALKSMEGNWSETALDAFLAHPKQYVPGTKMAFRGLSDPVQRADLIAYMASLAQSVGPSQDEP